jgi:hypothetical protein
MNHGFRAEHFELLHRRAGERRTSGDAAQDAAYDSLVEAYEATAAWAHAVNERLFADGKVRKLSRPTDMAQKFKHYTWVRIYPRPSAPKELAYTVGIDASGEFCVKLDTVQINGTPTRQRYDELRNFDNHTSPFAAILTAEEGLRMSFEELVDWSIDGIGAFEPGYDALAQELGLIPPEMKLITEQVRSRSAFAAWAGAMAGSVPSGATVQVPGQNIWMRADLVPAGVDARLGTDPTGSEWAVEINAPPQPGDHNRLAGIVEDATGGLHLLRQGWLRGRRSAPDVREAAFEQLTGMSAVPVEASGRAASRRWFLVASLDDPEERIRRTTTRFVELCNLARRGGEPPRESAVIEFVSDHDALLDNIETLDAIRANPGSADHAAYLELIRRGTCFLPYMSRDGIAFAPSRFIGYAGNSFARHAANEARDGRLTNAAINNVIGFAPVPEQILEEEYRLFCVRLGMKPAATGTFGAPRKYWLTAEIRDRLDLLAERAVIDDPELTVTQKEQLIQARIGQGLFRDRLLELWNGRCSVTACEIRPVLRASHIKPWRAADNFERLDRFNGLLLVANIDALFDRFMISFSDAGDMLYGPEIGRDDLIALGCDPNRAIAVSAKHAPYLAWHRAEYRARIGKG